MIEIEAKLRVIDDTTFSSLLQLRTLPPFRLMVAPEAELQRNTYLDSSDKRLRAAGYSLRVRTVGNRNVATLKQSMGSRNGVFQRHEWQVPVVQWSDPSAWPACFLRDDVLRSLMGAPLVAQFTIRTRRQHIYAVRHSTTVAEISLDEGTITAGNRAQWFREVEVELLSGGVRADMESLVAQLRERYNLVPETRSKGSRGRALRERVLAQPLESNAFAAC